MRAQARMQCDAPSTTTPSQCLASPKEERPISMQSTETVTLDSNVENTMEVGGYPRGMANSTSIEKGKQTQPSRGQYSRRQKHRKSAKVEKALAVASRMEKKVASRVASKANKSQTKSLWSNEAKKMR